MRGHERSDQRKRLSRSDADSNQSPRSLRGDDAGPRGGGNKHRWREREKPEPSVFWQTLAIFFAGLAGASFIAALTVPDKSATLSLALWLLSGAFALQALICICAHWDVNRGRKSREYETEELPPA